MIVQGIEKERSMKLELVTAPDFRLVATLRQKNGHK